MRIFLFKISKYGAFLLTFCKEHILILDKKGYLRLFSNFHHLHDVIMQGYLNNLLDIRDIFDMCKT